LFVGPRTLSFKRNDPPATSRRLLPPSVRRPEVHPCLCPFSFWSQETLQDTVHTRVIALGFHFPSMRIYLDDCLPSFAFSRALDQAISLLIRENRLRSYSVVPAIVVQSKRTKSDIWRPRAEDEKRTRRPSSSDSDKGSRWRDYLVDSTLERMELMMAGGLGLVPERL